MQLTPGDRIAVLGPFHPYRGGIAHHTTLLARTLAAEYRVLGVNFRRLYPSLLFPGKTQFDASDAPLQAGDVEVQRWVDSIGPFSWYRAARGIAAWGARLLLIQWWHPFFAPAFAAVARGARRAGCRTIFLCHNVLPHESSALDGGLVRLGLGSGDGYLVQSTTDRDNLQRLFPGRPYELTPHPAYTFFADATVDRETARARLGVEGPVVLFFGLVRRYKGLDTLIRAVARARRDLPVRLLVAGEFYEDRRPYEQLVHSLDLKDAVRLEDRYIPNEEVATWFRAADLVVLPYRSATQSGIVQIALGFQRPVIVTQVGGLPEAVQPGRTGTVVPPEDPEALAAAIVRFFADDEATRMRPHLETAVQGFSWDAMRDAVRRLASRLDAPSD